MKNEVKLTPEQQVQLEQKRLKISNAVLRARSERLQTLCNRFHFNNSDVLELEFSEYQRTTKSFDKAYSVIGSLTMQEADAIMPHLQARHQVAQDCLNLAQQRDKERLQKFRFCAIISQIFGSRKQPLTPIIQKSTTR